MKKKSILFLLVFVVCLSFSTIAMAANVNVTINGVAVNFNQSTGYPYVDSNYRTQVPLRGVMEKYGCEVCWDNTTKTAIVSKDNTVVKVPMNSSYVFVDDKKVQNDTTSVSKNGRIYLPIRIVLESFGANVTWNNTTSTVVVIDDNVEILPTEDLQVHFIDVGQADAILIDYDQYEVLIDAGNNNDGTKVVNYLKNYVNGNLDLVIATHTDADHIGGMDNVIASYQVNKIIDSGETKTTQTFKDYYNTAKAEPNCEFVYDSNQTISLGGDTYLKIIETGDGYSDSNNNSVVAMLTHGKVKVLFTGDMESDVENANLSKFSNVDVLKAGHHGSSTSSSKAFLNVIKPEYVVVSAGLNNSYGHPTATTLNNYFNIKAKVLGTFKSGHIVLTSNGNSYSFNSSKYLTINDAGSNDSVSNDVVNGQYVGNKNSKKLHLLSCRYASQISVNNIVYFNSKADAIGYEPCKVCNP